MAKGRLFTVSGPSGVGKGCIVRELLNRYPELRLSISCTTRDPRPGEEEGVHYYFVSKPRFEEMKANNELLESAYVHGQYYGTPRAYVEKMLDEGRNVILEIDVQGSLQVLANKPDTVGIFILPPSREELLRRLVGRNSETEDKIKLRMHNASAEIRTAPQFPYCIVNDDLEKAISDVRCVITAETIKNNAELDALYAQFKEEE